MPDKTKQRRTYKSFRKGLEEQQAMLANAETLARMGVPQDEALAIATRGNGEIRTAKGGKGLRAINNAAGYLQNNPRSLWNVAPMAALVASGATAPSAIPGLVGGTVGGVLGANALNNTLRNNFSKTFGELGRDLFGTNAEANEILNPGGLLGGAAGGLTGNFVKNIPIRNRIAYKTIVPYSYNNPFRNAANFLRHMFTDINVPKYNTIESRSAWKSNIKDDNLAIYLKSSDNDAFRDEAWRRYLGLKELTPLYVNNGNGTVSYNLPYVKKVKDNALVPDDISLVNVEGVIPDNITGNGGNIRLTKISDNVSQIYDVWDVNPFSGTYTKGLGTRILEPLYKAADKAYTSLYPKLYKVGTPVGKFNYNYLGGKFLNKFRNGQYTQKLQRRLNDIGRTLEIGPIVGGKPFTLKQNILFTDGSDDPFSVNPRRIAIQ